MGLFLRDEEVPTRRARSAKYNEHRTILASAERINLRNPQATQINRAFNEWQAAAWVGYKRVGEVHYGFGLLGSLLSRVRLFPALINDANESPSDITDLTKENKDRLDSQLVQDAISAMNDLTGKDFSSFIRKFSLNLSVPGECYLVHMPDVDDDGMPIKTWMICSISEVIVTGNGATYTPRRGGPKRSLPPDTFIARMWRQDPEYSQDADSSMVGVADSVEELLLCQRLTRGAARSRMNAGVLFVPDGVTTARTAPTGEPVLEEPGDDISGLAAMAQQDPGNDMVTQLMDAMVTPIGDEASAGGVVPLILIGPSDQGAAIRHVTFERKTDEWLVKRAENALDRILQGIDVPKEIIKGMAAVKYSNAVVIDENLYKANIEPLALVLADSLTSVYLWPVLKAKGYTDDQLKELVIWYDPSEIVTRPNSAQSANDGFDRGVLSPKAWRREHGFSESDAPDESDLVWKLMADVSRLPENVLTAMAEKIFGNYLDIKDVPVRGIPVTWGPNATEAAPNLKAVPVQGEQDSQRKAVQQVGVK
jgi:hypothetical protein